jgi:formate dehydrogenase iron-sulfur subunit
VACSEWNDLRDDVGENFGVYDNPRDLSPELDADAL